MLTANRRPRKVIVRGRNWVYAAALAVMLAAARWATLAMAAPSYQPDVGPAATTLTVTSTGDAQDVNTGDGLCNDGTGGCTLRAAIMEANASTGRDSIAFNLPGPGAHTVQPTSALPAITDPVVIDGYTQTEARPNTNHITTGSNAVLKIELDGSNAGGSSVHGLLITTGNSVVRGLVINRFSDNGVAGVSISGVGSTDNLVEGNFLGTDVTGTAPLGNTRFGVIVHLGASGNTVGGTASGARNLVSANRDYGVEISNKAHDNTVLGNFIGTDLPGTKRLGNGAGICVEDTTGNIIRGTTSGAGNLISGNAADGVLIDLGSMANLSLGNYIGTQFNGADPLGNGRHGVHIDGASDNTIGGASVEARNVIAHNGGNGVSVSAATGDAILGNYIFSNGGLGIDLAPDGVTLNDPVDVDTGPNRLQNFPMLTAATGGLTAITIEGNLNSTPNAQFRLEFFSNSGCDHSGYGEGERFLCFTNVTAGAGGSATFSVTFPTSATVAAFITATATDPDNNTGEFSKCVRVV